MRAGNSGSGWNVTAMAQISLPLVRQLFATLLKDVGCGSGLP